MRRPLAFWIFNAAFLSCGLALAFDIEADKRRAIEQSGERDPAGIAITSADGSPVTIELRIRDGGELCGPADIIGRIESKHGEFELYHVGLGECIGGEWPNLTFPKPPPAAHGEKPTPSPTSEGHP